VTIVAGVDEAGFGPVLGPLVVGAAVFRVPNEHRDASLWRLLAPAVCRRPARRGSAVVIGDSKTLYRPRQKDGLAHLERGVLGMLAAGGHLVRSLADLLASAAPAAPGAMGDYPWYAGGELALPTCGDASGVDLTGRALAAALARRDVAAPRLRGEVVFAGQFNRLVAGTRNKSVALFDVTSRLLAPLWRGLAGQEALVHLDRHGGRIHYVDALRRTFPDARLRVLREDPQASRYVLTDGRRRMELGFTPAAEQKQLPVALASMLAKYLRELFMRLFNAYWARQVSQVRPTAGYYVDGRRFYRDIAPAVQQLGVDEALLVRSR